MIIFVISILNLCISGVEINISYSAYLFLLWVKQNLYTTSIKSFMLLFIHNLLFMVSLLTFIFFFKSN